MSSLASNVSTFKAKQQRRKAKQDRQKEQKATKAKMKAEQKAGEVAKAKIEAKQKAEEVLAKFLDKHPGSITGDPHNTYLNGEEWTVRGYNIYFNEKCCVCSGEVGEKPKTIEICCKEGRNGAHIHNMLKCDGCVKAYPTVTHDIRLLLRCNNNVNRRCVLRQAKCFSCREPIWDCQEITGDGGYGRRRHRVCNWGHTQTR
jgi:hypothetical protein